MAGWLENWMAGGLAGVRNGWQAEWPTGCIAGRLSGRLDGVTAGQAFVENKCRNADGTRQDLVLSQPLSSSQTVAITHLA